MDVCRRPAQPRVSDLWQSQEESEARLAAVACLSKLFSDTILLVAIKLALVGVQRRLSSSWRGVSCILSTLGRPRTKVMGHVKLCTHRFCR